MKKHIYACQFLKYTKITQFLKFVMLLSLLLNFMRCANQSNITMELKDIAKELMTEGSAALITVDSLGVSHVRAMDPFLPEDNFTVWMGTNPKSSKVAQIKKNSSVSL
jgi:hypothetical protein